MLRWGSKREWSRLHLFRRETAKGNLARFVDSSLTIEEIGYHGWRGGLISSKVRERGCRSEDRIPCR